MKIMKILLITFVLGTSLLALNACRQTMKGAGEDIENAGDAVRDATN